MHSRWSMKINWLQMPILALNFYRYANSKLSSKSAVGPLINSGGSLTTDPSEKAILQQTFSQNFTSDNGVLPNTVNTKRSCRKLSYISFTRSLVRRVIKKLKHKTKAGPDGILPSFFVNWCEDLCHPFLYCMWRRCGSQSHVRMFRSFADFTSIFA